MPLSTIFNLIKTPKPLNVRTLRIFDNKPIIVNASQLSILLDRPDCFTADIEGAEYKVLRFLVKLDGELVFGAEGAPIPGEKRVEHIPVHYQMADMGFEAKCLTAGNAYFDKNNQLCIIDHKSGDFHPGFDTLQFAIKPLAKEIAAGHLKCNPILSINELNTYLAPIKTHPISIAEILSPLTLESDIALSADQQEGLLEEPTPPKITTGSPRIKKETQKHSFISMHILSGFMAVVGCAAVALAFLAFNASTFGIPGLIVAGLGVGMLLTGVGLFASNVSRDRAMPCNNSVSQIVISNA